MKKTLFLSAILATALCSSAFGAVSYTQTISAGDSITLGEAVTMSATPILLTINLANLQAVTSDTNIITTANTTSTWGLRAQSGGNVTGTWGTNAWTNAGTIQYSTIQGVAGEGATTVTLLATVNNSATQLESTDASHTSLYYSGTLKSGSPALTSYTLDGTGIVTEAYKPVFGKDISDISGSGTLTLNVNAEVNGGSNGGQVDMEISGYSVKFTGNTTLKSVGATKSQGSGITVGAGVTLTSSIISSWNPGNITLENNAKIVANKIQLSTNATSNLTGGTGASVTTGSLITYNGGKLNSSIGTFRVTGDVNLGIDTEDGATNDKLTISGGAFTVDGSVNILANRTFEATGGTVTLNGAVTVNGTFTNNATVNLNVQHGDLYARTENGYNTTHDILTFGGTGTVGGTGTWKINNTVATLTDRTLAADVTDTTKYYIDKKDATYDTALNGKYVIGEGRTLTIEGEKTRVNISAANNHGTLELKGMVGYFVMDANIGDVKLTGDGLTLTGGYSDHTMTINNLSGDGKFERSSTNAGKEYFAINGKVTWTGTLVHNRTNKEMVVKFADSDISFGGIESQDGTLNIESANGVTVNSVTLSSGTTTGVYTGTGRGDANVASLTTSTLTVGGQSTLNANLVVSANGTMDFSAVTGTGATLTMGCSVEIGNNVTVVIDESIIEGIVNRGETVAIITDVEAITSLENKTWHFQNAAGQSLDQYALRLEVGADGTSIVVAPEPATATLSLLALAGLMARRRRH